MEVASSRKGKISRNGVVVASCVWGNRMRFDEFKGGNNVYSEKEETPQVENDEKTNQVEEEKKLEMGSKGTNLDVVGGFVMSGKRRNWKSESSFEGNPIQISRKRSELCKELGVGAMKKSPIQSKKREGNEKMSELRKVKSVSPKGNLRNSLQLVKAKSVKCKELDGDFKKSDVIEENKVVVVDVSRKNLERVFSESSHGIEDNKVVVDVSRKNLERVFSESSDGNEENKVVVDELKKNLERVFDESSDVIEENKVVVDVLDESKKNLDGKNEKNCDLRKVKSMCLNGNLRNNSLQMVKTKSLKCNKSFEENKVLMEPQEKLNLESEDFKILEEEIHKEINLAQDIKTKKIVIVEEKKVHVSNNEKRAMSISPISGQSRIHHHPSPSRTKSVPASDEFQRNIPRQHCKLESLVDLVMWRDTSKSALIFGIGTFFIISSSYSQDLNISFISVISYLCLVYLATIFLFRSLRGANDIGESSEYVVGEEEAIWILKLILPYINEFLLKIRALFSGDPATTMKMAILLFILARCGSSITIWKMSKLGFFWSFHNTKSLFFLFHTINCLWYILD